jgi:type I restriction enzyme S subunit
MFREAIAVMAVGAAQLNVSPQEIGSIELPVPPLREQKKIAAILSSIDEAIETTQAVIDQLQVAKKAMMTELLTRGLPGRHTRFKQTEIGEVPEEWSVFTVGELLATGVLLDVQDGNHGAQHPKAADFVQSGVPFVMARDVVGGAINLSTCAFIRREQAEGLRIGFARPADVLLTHKGTIGRVGMVPTGMDYVVLTPQVTYYRTTPGKLLPVFLAASLEAEPLQRQLGMLAKQSTRDYIGITAQRQLQLALPTIEEQERLATAAQRFTNYLAQSEAELAARHMVKSALMSVLLTGEVRVKPDYEAA